jgi:hypothetical protein
MMGASKISEFAQMQGVGKFCRAAYEVYASKKYFCNAAVGMKCDFVEAPI